MVLKSRAISAALVYPMRDEVNEIVAWPARMHGLRGA